MIEGVTQEDDAAEAVDQALARGKPDPADADAIVAAIADAVDAVQSAAAQLDEVAPGTAENERENYRSLRRSLLRLGEGVLDGSNAKWDDVWESVPSTPTGANAPRAFAVGEGDGKEAKEAKVVLSPAVLQAGARFVVAAEAITEAAEGVLKSAGQWEMMRRHPVVFAPTSSMQKVFNMDNFGDARSAALAELVRADGAREDVEVDGGAAMRVVYDALVREGKAVVVPSKGGGTVTYRIASSSDALGGNVSRVEYRGVAIIVVDQMDPGGSGVRPHVRASVWDGTKYIDTAKSFRSVADAVQKAKRIAGKYANGRDFGFGDAFGGIADIRRWRREAPARGGKASYFLAADGLRAYTISPDHPRGGYWLGVMRVDRSWGYQQIVDMPFRSPQKAAALAAFDYEQATGKDPHAARITSVVKPTKAAARAAARHYAKIRAKDVLGADELGGVNRNSRFLFTEGSTYDGQFRADAPPASTTYGAWIDANQGQLSREERSAVARLHPGECTILYGFVGSAFRMCRAG